MAASTSALAASTSARAAAMVFLSDAESASSIEAWLAQARGPVHGALGEGEVAVVERIDAQAQDLERAGGLPRRADAAVDPLEPPGELGGARLEAALALRRLGGADLGVGELAGGLGVLPPEALDVVGCVLDAAGQLLGADPRPVALGGQLLEARPHLLDGRGRLGAPALDLRLLREGLREPLLETADLRQQGAPLALEARDLARDVPVRGARLRERRGGLGDELGCVREDGRELGLGLLELADLALALQRARRGVAGGADADRPGGDAGALGRDVDRTRHRRGVEGLLERVDHAVAAEQRRDRGAVPLADAQALDQPVPGELPGLVGERGVPGHEGHLAAGPALVEGRAPGAGDVVAALEDEGVDIGREQALNEALELARGLDEVARAREYRVGEAAGDRRHQLGGAGHALVEPAQTGELGGGLRMAAAGVGFPRAPVVEGGLRRGDRLAGLLAAVARVGELGLELLGAAAAALEGGAHLGRLVLDLLEARGVHRVLDLGVGYGLLGLDVLERGVVGAALGLPALARELGDGVVELHAARVQLIGRGTEGGHVGAGDLGGGAHLVELAVDVLELGGGAAALMLGAREGAAHLGEARDHVAPLLLEQAHVAADTAYDVLHMAALLAQVADEQPLLLEHHLQLLELALLLAEPVAGEFEGCVALLGPALQVGPGGLEAAQLVDGEDLGELAGARGELAVLARAVDLALEGLQLPPDLAVDVAGARQVLVHGGDLAGRALPAALVLGDAGGLLDEAAALLGPALEDRVELALGDDGVRILAEAGVVQNVLDVHEAAGARVDQVLALPRAVHAPGDGDLLEVHGQDMVRVVEHERDLGDADRLAGGGAGEDDVLHGLAAQLLGALLPQDPQDGVGDIRFTRAVGPHDDGEPGLEGHLRAVGEGFEPLQGERLEIHRMPR